MKTENALDGDAISKLYFLLSSAIRFHMFLQGVKLGLDEKLGIYGVLQGCIIITSNC